MGHHSGFGDSALFLANGSIGFTDRALFDSSIWNLVPSIAGVMDHPQDNDPEKILNS